jgi:hypothetical protein
MHNSFRFFFNLGLLLAASTIFFLHWRLFFMFWQVHHELKHIFQVLRQDIVLDVKHLLESTTTGISQILKDQVILLDLTANHLNLVPYLLKSHHLFLRLE